MKKTCKGKHCTWIPMQKWKQAEQILKKNLWGLFFADRGKQKFCGDQFSLTY